LQALLSNTTGTGNVAIGNNALSNCDTGNSNTVIGFNAGAAVTTANNVICIGNSVFGANVDGGCYIGNIFGVTSPSGIGVFINSSGQLGTSTSSRRFKEGIKPVDKASEVLFSVTPVTFHYKEELDPAA
jgi:Chaperone of endosialidase